MAPKEYGYHPEFGINFSELDSEAKNEEGGYYRYLQELGLTTDEIRDKSILDVGSGSADFAAFAKKMDISARRYSVDVQDGQVNHPFRERERAVVADGMHLPFADGSMDMVVSTSALPNELMGSGSESEEVLQQRFEQFLLEQLRVLKPGGELRLGNVFSDLDMNSESDFHNRRMGLFHKAWISAIDQVTEKSGSKTKRLETIRVHEDVDPDMKDTLYIVEKPKQS